MKSCIRVLVVLMLAAAPLVAQSAIVEGKVIEMSSGRPVPKAEVLLRGLTQSGNPPDTDNYAVETDAEGHFRIEGIIPGKYAAKPSRAGFLTRFPGRPDLVGSHAQLNLKAGEQATIELKLIGTGVISGRAIDMNNDAVAGALVQALRYSYPSRDPVEPGTSSGGVPADARKRLAVIALAESDDRGEFRIFGLAPGRYYLRVEQRQPNRRGDRCGGGAPGATIPEDSVAVNNFQFIPTGSFVGQFSGEFVTYLGCSGSVMRSASSSVLGFAQTYYPSTYEFAQAAPIDVMSGGEVSNIAIRLRMEEAYSIHFIPSGLPDGSPFSIEIRGRGDSDPRPLSMTIMENIVGLLNVLPGSYIVAASTLDHTLRARQLVDVVDRDIDGVSLKFEPLKKITGAVQAEGKLTVPFSGMNVEFEPDNAESPVSTTRVNPDGTFTAYVLPEAYTLVRPRLVDAYVKSVKLGDRELTGPHIDVARESGPLTILFGVDGGNIQGTVIEANGQPAASVITLIPRATDPAWAGRLKVADADDNGAFTIPAVAPGEYKLFAWQDVERNAPLDPEFRKAYESQGVVVKISPNQRVAVQLKPIATH